MRVPVSANFSPIELGLSAGFMTLGLVLGWKAEDLSVEGPRRMSSPGPLDTAVSDALYRGPGAGPFLGGIPDRSAYVFPAAALLWYGGEGIATAVQGASLTGNPNADHEFHALTEAYGITLFVTQATKLLGGRERPMYALQRQDADSDESQRFLSFFSAHTSSTFVLAAFVTRDLGDWLASRLPDEASTGKRLGARIGPGILLYGAAGLVGFSRIVEQDHYLSDVLVGAAVGGTIGNLVYALHFDSSGRPRQRLESSSNDAPETMTTPRSSPFLLSVHGRF